MTEPRWLERRDDRARLLSLAALAAGVASLQRLETVGLSLGLGLSLCAAARLRPGQVARRLAPLAALLLPVALLTPLWAPHGSTALIPSWPWGPTDMGLIETARVSGRVLSVALVVVAFLAAVPFDRTIHALQRLWVPASLVHVTLLTYRYLFDLRADAGRMQQALAARAFRPRLNLTTTRTVATVTGSLLVRSLARTERVEQAMRCRGYAGRVAFPPQAPGGLVDALLVLVVGLASAGLVLWDRGWVG